MTRSKISAVGLVAIFVSAVVLFGPGHAAADASQSDAVLRAAKTGLASWLDALPRNELRLYGFESASELAGAQVGDPIEIVTLTPEELRLGSTGGGAPQVSPLPTGEWYVPVTVNGRYRCLLSVAKLEGKWEVVGLSAAQLAKELDQVNQQLPAEASRERLSGLEPPRLMRIYQARADLLYVTTRQGEFLVPLRSARQALNVTREEWLDPSSAIPRLRNAVDAALANEAQP